MAKEAGILGFSFLPGQGHSVVADRLLCGEIIYRPSAGFQDAHHIVDAENALMVKGILDLPAATGRLNIAGLFMHHGLHSFFISAYYLLCQCSYPERGCLFFAIRVVAAMAEVVRRVT